MYNPLKWASTLIQSFHQHGVDHAVISPGSRSTPLTLASAIHPGIQKKVVLDERSAAFMALGIGKSTGKPAILICTSGTAIANYFPAVIEAKESGVPMVILSADRPPNLRNIGSSQTIDQLKLFGDQTVFFHEAGEPVMKSNDLKRIQYLAKQAVETAIEKGGAAHINLPFRKPLEPTELQISEEIQAIPASEIRKSQPVISRSNIILTDEIYELFSKANRPLIIAGPVNSHHSLHKQLSELSGHIDAPVIAETGSRIKLVKNQISRYEQFLRNSDILNSLMPDLIIRFGDQPFTKSVLVALEKWANVPLIHFASRRAWQDHSMSTDYKIFCTPNDSIKLNSIPKKNHSEWNKLWNKFDAKAESKLETVLQNEPVLTDGHVFFHMKNQLPNDWNVMLSNSFIPRDMALFGKNSFNQFVNRGAAGIDGITSTAIGIHLSSNQPTCCITGDLAFLHDSNALLSMEQTNNPFLIVVVNNNGGTIFRMLPVYKSENEGNFSEDMYQHYFETPQITDIKKLAEASGIEHQLISTQDELRNFSPDQIKKNTIIECVTDAGKSMNIRQELWNF